MLSETEDCADAKAAYPFLKEYEILAFFEIENMQFFLCKVVSFAMGNFQSLEMHYIKAVKKLASGEYLESVLSLNLEDVHESDLPRVI